MNGRHKEMVAALKREVLPLLREQGFKGSFPHFRRHTGNAIDLITFQFDKWGGGFVIEIARSPPDGLVTPWRETIPPEKVKAWDVHPTGRKRIKATADQGVDGWFRFDVNPIDQVAALVVKTLGANQVWNDLGR